MKYEEWLAGVPSEIRNDPLWNMRVYQLAMFVADLAWRDVSKLAKDGRTLSVSSQLYRAVGSIGANVAEGYSRQSRKDQARFYEYALGSAREARGWYFQVRHVLSPEVVAHRLQVLAEIARLLLSIIPSQRGYTTLKDDPCAYTITQEGHLDDPPMPQ